MEQLRFEGLLQSAAQDNANRAFAREAAHLPDTFEAAVTYYRDLILQHDRAMRVANLDAVMSLRKDAHLLAKILNGGDPGILACDDAPAYRLERSHLPEEGCMPLWGQSGTFVISVGEMDVRIELDGIFGIGAKYSYWPGFAAHAVDWGKPFLSETGYRSFLGIHAEPKADLTPAAFATTIIQNYVEKELRGRLQKIGKQFRA